MPDKYNRCFIICAGDIEISEIPVKEGDFVIAADGGYLYCRVFAVTPDCVIGDFDSLEEAGQEELALLAQAEPEKVIRLQAEKDDTDTLAAIRLGLSKGIREFHFYGALGGRLEHTIANIQSLLFLKNRGAKGYIWDGNTMLTVIKDESIAFQKEMEGTLSIFSLGEKAEGVTETGLKYKLDKAVVTNDFPVGISNEFMGKQAEISVEKGALLVMITWV